MLRPILLRLMLALILLAIGLPISMTNAIADNGDEFIIGHENTDITQVPQWAIEAAKANLHIGYGHTSHGAQISGGMTGLVGFANDGGLGLSLPPDIFAFNNGGISDALDMEETNDGWLNVPSNHMHDYFIAKTIEYLDDPSHADVNVIMWAWCSELSHESDDFDVVSEYLEPMNQLEADYPGVTFIYWTGHTDHESPIYDTRVKARNAIIRQYCIDNHKILYDFFDIESYVPDDLPTLSNYTYYEFTDDTTYYFNSTDNMTPMGNWAYEWQNAHPGKYYACYAPHIDTPDGSGTGYISANLKAYAAWWLFARLAGWQGIPNPPGNHSPEAVNDNYNVSKGGIINIPVATGVLDNDTDADSDNLTAYKVSNPAHGTLTLNADGSFTYVHDDSETTTDTFTYKVHDGYIVSDTAATVTITVSSADTESPMVTVTSPNGGENFKKGCLYDIIWTADDNVGVTSIDISYSTNAGSSYSNIVTGIANDGTYSWTIPDEPSTECLVKVVANDAAGNPGEDTSDAVFEICNSILGDANDDGWVNALDITRAEQIILDQVSTPPLPHDADANEDSTVNILDITIIEHIITVP